MTFLYRKNLQEDITGVIEATTGQLMAEYSYDAYGNVEILSNNDAGTALLGAIITVYNPLLYRGYAYSILGGTLAYYLGSRFYMPQLGRFLNADKHTDTDTGVVGTNMYAYCNNNPVMFIDPSGEALKFMMKVINWIVNLVTAIKNNIGTQNKPHEITPGKTVSVHNDTYWFSCEVRGATDINVSVNTKNVTIVIYEKKLIGKEQIHYSNSTNLSYIAKKSNSNKYLVYISALGGANITCTIKQHIDKISNSTGGKWIGGSAPFPYLDSDIIYHEKLFYDKESVGMIHSYIDHENFLDLYSNYLNGTLSLVDIALSLGIPTSKVAKFISSIMSVSSVLCFSVDFAEILKNQIDKLCEYDEKTDSYKKGIVLTKKSLNGIYTYDYEIWEGPIMYGEGGYVGRWEIF